MIVVQEKLYFGQWSNITKEISRQYNLTPQIEQMQDKWCYMYQKQGMLIYKYGVKYLPTFWYNNKWMQKVLDISNTIICIQKISSEIYYVPFNQVRWMSVDIKTVGYSTGNIYI